MMHRSIKPFVGVCHWFIVRTVAFPLARRLNNTGNMPATTQDKAPHGYLSLTTQGPYQASYAGVALSGDGIASSFADDVTTSLCHTTLFLEENAARLATVDCWKTVDGRVPSIAITYREIRDAFWKQGADPYLVIEQAKSASGSDQAETNGSSPTK